MIMPEAASSFPLPSQPSQPSFPPPSQPSQPSFPSSSQPSKFPPHAQPSFPPYSHPSQPTFPHMAGVNSFPPPPPQSQSATTKITTAAASAQAFVGMFSSIMIGLAIYAFFTCGTISTISNILVLVQGIKWKMANSSVTKLIAMTGSSSSMEMGGLAITGIVLGIIELLVSFAVGILNGSGVIGINGWFISNGQCLACLLYTFSNSCDSCRGIKPPTNSAMNMTTWMSYAFGVSVVVSALNISMCVVSMKILKILNSIDLLNKGPNDTHASSNTGTATVVSRNPINAWGEANQ
jgi:hypothetical protein